jgi:magnesium transporter
MISATFTSMILSYYETNLAIVAGGALYAFVPMLMGTAGNAGNQTSVTIIRALALGEVDFKKVFKVILKEFCASLLLGVTVGVVCFLKLWLVDSLYNDLTIEIAFIVSGVLVLAIIMAKLVGCLLPLVAKQFKLDPAVVASPFMTTIVDVLSLIVYCTISIALLA